jgi:hypothetical protein
MSQGARDATRFTHLDIDTSRSVVEPVIGVVLVFSKKNSIELILLPRTFHAILRFVINKHVRYV